MRVGIRLTWKSGFTPPHFFQHACLLALAQIQPAGYDITHMRSSHLQGLIEALPEARGGDSCGYSSRNLDRNFERDGDNGLLWSNLRLRRGGTFYRTVKGTAAERVFGWTGVDSWRFTAAFLPACLRDAICTVARSREALDAHHLFALTAWDTRLIRQH